MRYFWSIELSICRQQVENDCSKNQSERLVFKDRHTFHQSWRYTIKFEFRYSALKVISMTTNCSLRHFDPAHLYFILKANQRLGFKQLVTYATS